MTVIIIMELPGMGSTESRRPPRTLHQTVAQGGRVPHEALEADGESDAWRQAVFRVYLNPTEPSFLRTYIRKSEQGALKM